MIDVDITLYERDVHDVLDKYYLQGSNSLTLEEMILLRVLDLIPPDKDIMRNLLLTLTNSPPATHRIIRA